MLTRALALILLLAGSAYADTCGAFDAAASPPRFVAAPCPEALGRLAA